MTSFQLAIITPEGRVFDGEVTSLVAPAYDGYVGVLAHHAPMVATLTPGLLTVRTAGETRLYAVGEGVLEVNPEDVTILADTAEKAVDENDARERLEQMRSPWQIQAADGQKGRANHVRNKRIPVPVVASPGDHGRGHGGPPDDEAGFPP